LEIISNLISMNKGFFINAGGNGIYPGYNGAVSIMFGVLRKILKY